MKRLLLLSLLPLFSLAANAQQLDTTMRREVVEAAATRMEQSYVLAEPAQAMAKTIREKLRRGEYDNVTDAAAFAQRLAEDLRAVSRDNHLNVTWNPAGPPPVAQQEAEARAANYGFARVEVLDGNVGYIDVSRFFPPQSAARTADAAMSFVANTRALIFDLRRHVGGQPDMVAYLASYLFGPEPVLINEIYSREQQKTLQYRTHVVPGPRYSGKVYVLTSDFTFSAAEEFAYDLKNLGRAKVIGETTGGGAHPVATYRLPHGFLGIVPNRRAINPISNTNWEGVGVEPDVKVKADDALRAALAAIAAENTDAATPAVRAALDAWVKSFNEDDRAGRERFLRERSTLPAGEFAQMDVDLRAQFGKYELVRIISGSATAIEALLRHPAGGGGARVALQVDASGKISDVQLEAASPE
ncbi:MAG TPA: S41 family peptidase [Thermoanaerobaculia bacterium]|nr:S41 family peptidase [Thermoanaerobaculia bacterium]